MQREREPSFGLLSLAAVHWLYPSQAVYGRDIPSNRLTLAPFLSLPLPVSLSPSLPLPGVPSFTKRFGMGSSSTHIAPLVHSCSKAQLFSWWPGLQFMFRWDCCKTRGGGGGSSVLDANYPLN